MDKTEIKKAIFLEQGEAAFYRILIRNCEILQFETLTQASQRIYPSMPKFIDSATEAEGRKHCLTNFGGI